MPIFYRIVHGDPPPREDMLSLEAQGRTPRRLSPRKERMAKGVSVFDTLEAAWNTAANAPRFLGNAIAELDVPEGGPIEYELTADYGHYTLWGDADTILATVRRVVWMDPYAEQV